MRIITGSTGKTHVTSNDDGEFNQGLWGNELVVMENGNKLAASIIDNNTIRIKDGDILVQGRHALIEPNTTEDITIETGVIGYNRNDLIVARYALSQSTGYEDITLEIIKGVEVAGTASDPNYAKGDIRTGAMKVEVPLYRVKIKGVTIEGVEPLFNYKKSLCKQIEEVKQMNSDLEINISAKFYEKEISLLAAGWTASTSYSGFYEQSISTTDYINDSKPFWFLVPANGVVPSATEVTAYNTIVSMVVTTTKVTFYADSKPTTALKVGLVGR